MKRDGDGVEVIECAGCNGRAVAHGIFVVADNPVGPGFTRAGHGVHIQDADLGRLLDHGASPVHVVHVLQLLGGPGDEQTIREIVVAIMHHAGDGKIELGPRFDVR